LSARIQILPEPRLRGTSDALDRELIAEILADNPMEDLFLLIVDRDCDRLGNEALARQRQREHPEKLIACLARQEVEVWMLALYEQQLGASFGEVRQHCDPKERFADPLLDEIGREGPGQGRKAAMRALKGRWQSLLDSCSELAELRSAVAAWSTIRD
jgi:hypothetical protein